MSYTKCAEISLTSEPSGLDLLPRSCVVTELGQVYGIAEHYLDPHSKDCPIRVFMQSTSACSPRRTTSLPCPFDIEYAVVRTLTGGQHMTYFVGSMGSESFQRCRGDRDEFHGPAQ